MELTKILLFAGAGVSKESGLDTFRDQDGLWSKFDVKKVCDFSAFLKNKENLEFRQHLFEFYNEVKKAVANAAPNAAHEEVAYWQKKYGAEKVKIFTANVDDLFERAGCVDVTHVHGDLSSMQCSSCSKFWSCSEFKDQRCPFCNSRLTKPSVVFFGEKAPLYAKLRQAFHPKRREKEDLLVYAGSSQQVIVPKDLFLNISKGFKIVVNTQKCEQDNVFDEKIYARASEGFKQISKLLATKYYK